MCTILTNCRDLVDGFVADVKSGAIVVPKGSLARMLQDHVNKSRHITFFEKLVSRRKLNQELAALFAPREPRAGDKVNPQPKDAQAALGGQKRKRGRRRRSAKEALLSLLDNPELVTLMQQGGFMGGAAPSPAHVSMQMPHGLPAVHSLSVSVPQMVPPQLGHAAPAVPSFMPTSGSAPPFMPPAGYFGVSSGVPTPALPSGPVGYSHGTSMPHGVPANMRFAPAFGPAQGASVLPMNGPSTMGMPAAAAVSMPLVPPHLQQHSVFWNGVRGMPNGRGGPLPAGSRLAAAPKASGVGLSTSSSHIPVEK